MSQLNKFGLSRHISADVKRQVRQQSGFGCVVCGNLLYEYEHVDPPFAEARSHNPECITLLCPACHARVTRGIWSKHKIAHHHAKPVNLLRGYTSDALIPPPSGLPYSISIGSTFIEQCEAVAIIARYPLIWFEPPEAPNAPTRLNAWFVDADGKFLAEIIRNEFRGYIGNWDCEIRGPDIWVYDKPRRCGIHLRREGDRELQVMQMNIRYMGYSLIVDKGGPFTITDSRMNEFIFLGDASAGRSVFEAEEEVPWERPPHPVIPLSKECMIVRDRETLGFVHRNMILARDGRKVVGRMRKGGHVYRVSGEYVGKHVGTRIVKDGDLDPDGRPIYVPGKIWSTRAALFDYRPDVSNKKLGTF